MIRLSKEAEDRIEFARAEAEKEYRKRRDDLDRDGQPYAIWAQFVSAIAVDFLHTVFFAYATEFLKSGASAAEVRLAAVSKLAALADELLASVKWPAFKPLPQNALVSSEHLIEAKKRQVINEIEQHPDWQNFLDKLVALAQSHSSSVGKPVLKVGVIREWMREGGWDNNTLAEELKVSKRVVSSMLNNGRYHGRAAVRKLANLMRRDVLDLYQE